MKPQLVASAASGLGGVSGDLSWNMTIPNLGRRGLIVIGWVGKEDSGEENPEEINAVYFNGVSCTIAREANTQTLGSGLAFLTYPNIPPAGTYACSLNFQDSPKQAEKKRGVSAAFTNIKAQAQEVDAAATWDNSPIGTSLTPLTNNALVVATLGWQTGFPVTWNWGTPITETRADNAVGCAIAYSVVSTPSLQSVSVSGNMALVGLAVASFAMQAIHTPQIL